jgi:IS5 family transposase
MIWSYRRMSIVYCKHIATSDDPFMSQTPISHPSHLAEQQRIRLPLPIVQGNRDYQERENLLRRMNDLLVSSGVEQELVQHDIQCALRAAPGQAELTDRRRATIQTYAKRTLRCTVARILSNQSHRQFSAHVAESPLLQWFCGYDALEVIRVPSKSTLQRMESSIPQELLSQLNAILMHQAGQVSEDGQSALGLAEPIDLSLIWMDATCAQLDIHYPTDWALLRDGTRSIMRAIMVIRRHGLKRRMPDPTKFIAAMNQQAMAMSGASRRGRGGDKAKARKRALRAMKRVAKKVVRHGERYLNALRRSLDQTDLSEAEAAVIINRLVKYLEMMPMAIHQAHERIIGERVVPNDEKILSLYEPHAEVYVRGKAGADAEFGLQLLLSESAEGLIVDCHLVPEGIQSDSTLLMPAIKRMRAALGESVASTVVTDRGFSSAANSDALKALDIVDSTLPRNSGAMQKMLASSTHRALHRRRAQTEARIGIFKANFLGDQLPTKGLVAQQRYVAWAALSHNLWVLGRLDVAEAAAEAA